ncbi:MAG TPA: hypothetical protein PKE21_06965 [Flavobacteriales bacterium]|mgnify:CR=1 FL=1|nr:hypothetical protein [Flavobacteriales bacterium]HMR27201.1 hypothetical protein [Flavobacteriales bacterium]
MTSILPWSIAALTLATAGLALLIAGYRRRAAWLLIPGVLCLMASTVCAGVVVVKALRQSVEHPRTDVASPQADAAS